MTITFEYTGGDTGGVGSWFSNSTTENSGQCAVL